MSTMTSHTLRDFSRIHCIGVGGIGMSALARLFLHEKKQVSGSDRSASDIIRALEGEGVIMHPSQVKENITDDIELVVYTEAMAHDHEEMVAARALGVPMMNYFEALGMVANEYYLIAVAGSHGKTTTTAMLIDIFEDAGLDPTAVVGSLRARTKSNYRAGKSKYFIVEACEYKRDFLSLRPDVLIITNVEYEHVDYYRDLADVQDAFRSLVGQVREGGFVIAQTTASNIAPIVSGMAATLVDYDVFVNPTHKLRVPGVHNMLNAAAARAASHVCGIADDVARAALSTFSGTWRRFEYKGEARGAPVYDDYGHHPTEIKATLQGARELYPHKRIVLIFEPHTYSRVHALFNDFVAELGEADEVVLVPIYAAREENTSGVTSDRLAETICAQGGSAVSMPSLADAVTHVREVVRENDVVLVMGAGTVTGVATELVS